MCVKNDGLGFRIFRIPTTIFSYDFKFEGFVELQLNYLHLNK